MSIVESIMEWSGVVVGRLSRATLDSLQGWTASVVVGVFSVVVGIYSVVVTYICLLYFTLLCCSRR